MNPKNLQIFFPHSGHSKAGVVWPTITYFFNLNSKTNTVWHMDEILTTNTGALLEGGQGGQLLTQILAE